MLEALVDPKRTVTGGTRRWLAVASALAALLASGALAVPAAANGCPSRPFGGGSGTQADPFLLWNATDLRNVAASSTCWGYSYALSASIDVAGSAWTPIGTSASPFTGDLDGRGFAVSGISIPGSASQQGLFGVVRGTASDLAVIRDLRLVSVAVAGSAEVGALAGLAEFATVSGVSASGTVSGTTQVGGLVGQLGATARGSTLAGSTSSVAVTATGTDAGGLVGLLAAGSSVSGSSASGPLSGTTQVGGLVGLAQGGIASSSASGSVTATGGAAGGLAGSSASTITASTASGAVSAGGNGAGGLVGTSTGSVTESSATGSVTATGQSNIGGLVGSFNGVGGATTIARSYATGAVSGGANVGGLVGLLTQSSLVDTFASGAVNGASRVGGLVGYADVPSTGGVERAYAKGTVTATGSPGGGLIADGRPVTVIDSWWATDATGQAASPGGGSASTLAALRDLDTFTDWAIVSGTGGGAIWGICPAVNGGTPFLQWAVSVGACTGSGSPPPPWLQAYGRLAASDPCDPGWAPSWERWMNAGTGGFTCVRTVRSSD